MAFSKIIYNGTTLMDVTGTTALPADVNLNKVFTKADGVQSTGSVEDGDELEYGSAASLVGTTWIINENPVITESKEYSINFIYSIYNSPISPFSGFKYEFNTRYNSGALSWYSITYSAWMPVWSTDGNWETSSADSRTISITGGTDATNADLISWLQANATKQ